METPAIQSVEFNYFHRQFLMNIPRKKAEKVRNRISPGESDLDDIFTFVYMERLPQEEEIELYNQVLWDICNDYIVLSDAKIDIVPNDLFDFINLILETMEENPYSDSFLKSLAFIYQEYMGCLDIGFSPLWGSKKENKEPYLEITFDSNQRITKIESINMDFLEQDQIMTKIISMAIRKQTQSMQNPEEYKPSKVIIKQLEEKL